MDSFIYENFDMIARPPSPFQRKNKHTNTLECHTETRIETRTYNNHSTTLI